MPIILLSNYLEPIDEYVDHCYPSLSETSCVKIER